MKNLIYPINCFVLLLLSWFWTLSVFAQTMQYRDPAQPELGAWQITTDPISKNTVIRFFDGNKNQFYEEIIAGKYIKLTDRNIFRINQSFDQMVLKSIVAAQVKADPLDSPTFRKLSDRQSKKQSKISANQASNFKANVSLKAHTYQVGKTMLFYLIVQNPEKNRIIVDLSDEQGQSLYHESFSFLNYRRRFDLTGMTQGQYQLLVTTANRKQKYTRRIHVKPQTPLFPENQPDSLRQVNQELANRSNRLYLPLVK
ncbi:hypothetical protein [Adhaeribacter pallidiroseus]|uniref:Uncharacterized protein n=1 Tax=Adhaeribacter pallidiroseus TaxID=2072847 RepID=A0A369QIN6_9BACT|nr:hypothetical protein [Adhaeribacter pallidiroseus]RDC62739.1 hypothetical protein AHMF7616_01333 [Adhaeribacter pallidiroseus]